MIIVMLKPRTVTVQVGTHLVKSSTWESENWFQLENRKMFDVSLLLQQKVSLCHLFHVLSCWGWEASFADHLVWGSQRVRGLDVILLGVFDCKVTRWKILYIFFWIYHWWAALATTISKVFLKGRHVESRPTVRRPTKIIPKNLTKKRRVLFVWLESWNPPKRMLSGFIPGNFLWVSKGWCPDFQHTHARDRSEVLRSLLFGILQDDFHRPKKVTALFQADKNNLKSLVTMFICLNQAKKTSKQSPINMNPNDQAKYSTHTLNISWMYIISI